MTKAEVLLWLELKNKKLGVRVLRQYSVGPFVIDFYCPELKFAIEVDGVTHLTEDEIEYDKYREIEIGQLGIKFIRFTNHEIFDDRINVIEKLKKMVEELKLNVN